MQNKTNRDMPVRVSYRIFFWGGEEFRKEVGGAHTFD